MAFDSEKAILALCLRSPIVVDEATAVGIKRDHFSSPTHRLFWSAFVEDRERGIGPDRATLTERFADKVGERRHFTDWQHFGKVMDDITSVPAIRKNVEHYVSNVIETARRQYMVDAARRILDHEESGSPFSELIKLSSTITNLASWAPEGRSEPRTAHDITKDYLDDLQAQRMGLKTNTLISTGIPALDSILKVRPGQMVIIGGRPKMGKSAVMMTLLSNIARYNGAPTLSISAEMNEMQIGERIAMSEANLGETAEDLEGVRSKILSRWDGLPVYYDDKPKSLGAALMSIRMQKSNLDICAAAVDYLQLLKLPKENSRERQVAEASSAFKRLSMELNIPIFVLAQLNRSCEYRENKRPMLSDLRDSGQIEQDADAVIFVYRHSVYDEDHEPVSDLEMIVRAQRNGPTGTAHCSWEPGNGWITSRR